jgi:integrase/recombinase XerD
MRLREAAELLALQWRGDGRAENTIANYLRHLALLERWLTREGRSDDLAAIDHHTIALFLNSSDVRMSCRGGLRRTVSANAVRTSLRVAFAHFNDAGYVGHNAARLVRRARCSPPPPRGLSAGEIDRLMAALIAAQGVAARRDHLLIDVLLSTGIRVGNAVALDRDDIDLDRRVMNLRAVKGGNAGHVYFNVALKDHFVGHFAHRPPGAVFRNPSGARLSRRSAQRAVARWLARAGIDHGSAHALRHSFATALLRQTNDVFLVQRALLHRSVASTIVYLSVADDRLRAALDDVHVATGGWR